MVEKKLQVCDMCEERVSKHKCIICNTDLCTTCAKKLPLFSTPNLLCKSCLKKTTALFKDNRFVDQFMSNFAKLVQSSNILEELEED